MEIFDGDMDRRPSKKPTCFGPDEKEDIESTASGHAVAYGCQSVNRLLNLLICIPHCGMGQISKLNGV